METILIVHTKEESLIRAAEMEREEEISETKVGY